MTKPEIFFTSDTHFGHSNIIKYCNRPYGNTHDMNNDLINRWNSKIKKNDIVYHLGDFLFKTNKKYAHDILWNLNGIIRVVRGNHDKILKGNLLDRFEWIKDYHEIKQPESVTPIILSHYAFEVWNGSHRGSWHLHGHSHGNLKFKNIKRLDVGVDTNGMNPYSLEDIKTVMDNRI